MAQSRLGHIGLGKETTWGTAVAATAYVPFVSESITLEKEQLIDPSIKAIFDESPSYEGLNTISGDITFEVRPEILGYFLRSALGAPTTTQPDAVNAPSAYQHEFIPAQTKFADDCHLWPYTIEIHRDLGTAFQYAGCVVNNLQLTFGVDQKILRAVASIIGKSVTTIAATTPSFETADPWIWKDATITIGGASNTMLESFQWAVNNNCEGLPTINGSRDIGIIHRTSPRTFPLSLTFTVDDLTEYNRFANQNETAFVVTLTGATIEGGENFKLVLDMPKVRYTAFPVNMDGGRVTVDVTAVAKYDSTNGYATKVTLENTTTSY